MGVVNTWRGDRPGIANYDYVFYIRFLIHLHFYIYLVYILLFDVEIADCVVYIY